MSSMGTTPVGVAGHASSRSSDFTAVAVAALVSSATISAGESSLWVLQPPTAQARCRQNTNNRDHIHIVLAPDRAAPSYPRGTTARRYVQVVLGLVIQPVLWMQVRSGDS